MSNRVATKVVLELTLDIDIDEINEQSLIEENNEIILQTSQNIVKDVIIDNIEVKDLVQTINIKSCELNYDKMS